MVDDSSQQADAAPDANRTKRAPPTIDLEATKVIDEAKTPSAEAGTAQDAASDVEPKSEPEDPESEERIAASSASPARSISPWVIAPFSGAVAAALVIAVGWVLGWPAVQAPGSQVDAAQLDSLAGRLAAVEQKLNKPTVDPTAAARLDTLEKSISSVRGDLANLRAQSEKLANTLNEVKAAPPSAPSVDLSGINDRIAQLERVSRTQGTEIAQEGERLADAKSADDTPLRRVVAAALLDVQVRHGDPYVQLLAAAKTLDPDPDALKPLDQFAGTGVPNVAALSRELLALVPKLSPSVHEQSNNETGIIDRLQAGAAKLVRIERTDAVGNDRSGVIGRATAAALRNDLADARRELKTLDPADRAAVQAWLDKADARDAALAASRKFADDAMAALAKPAQ